jgi:tRNA(fMet)-specific endonuclease VapC
MILCDTDVFIEFYKNSDHIVQELRVIGQTNIAVSAITQAELYYGALNKSELQKIHNNLQIISCLPLDEKISVYFLNLMKSYSLSHKIDIPDAIIAATAIIHHVPLYTLNTRHFRFIPEIQLHHPITY